MNDTTFYFLGTGTSCGVPQLGCTCDVCTSKDSRDHRLRTSALFETAAGTRILLDCGPDFRQQMFSLPYGHLDAVLLTHEHYDHVGGIDDLRPFASRKAINIYADNLCLTHLKERIPYCFVDKKYPGVPNLLVHEVLPNHSFRINEVVVTPIRVLHGTLPILGYRLNNMAYITDMTSINSQELLKIKNLEVLVINALRKEKHHSHQNLDEALALIEKTSPHRSYLVHMSHQMGRHEIISQSLPQNVFLAYDGLKIEF